MPPTTNTQYEEFEPFLLSDGPVEEERFRTRFIRRIIRTWSEVPDLITSEQAVGIFKCSLAYLLASLAVFIPFIGSVLGNQNGKHLVATITVYFHPARSQGSMYKALIYAFVAFLFAAFLSLSSMWVTIVFHRKHDLIELGHAVVLIFFVGGGFGFIGWFKQRLNDPLVNVACSLASVASVLVITREGAVQTGELSFTKISQVLRMVLFGIGISTAVSFWILPVSARKKFRGDLSTLTGTATVLLMSITESFLQGADHGLQTPEFTKLSQSHDRIFGRWSKLLGETKLEHYMAGTTREHRLEKRLVCFMQDITHIIGGLRGVVTLQSKLLAPTKYTRRTQHSHMGTDVSNSNGPENPTLIDPPQSTPRGNNQVHANEPEASSTHSVTHSPAEIFETLTSRLEVSIVSLASTLNEIFTEVSFGPALDENNGLNFDEARIRIDLAIDTYREARNSAFASLYREWGIVSLSPVDKTGLEEILANCEYFSVSFLELSEQLKQMLSVLAELQAEVNERPNGKSWDWLHPSRWWANRQNMGLDLDSAPLSSEYRVAFDSRNPAQSSSTLDQSEDHLRGWPRNQSAKDNVVRPFSFIRKDEIKFALKVGIGAALFALPSFISFTRPFYLFWRGEWGLISYMLVCSMTIGASNTTGFARFLGTCIGGLCSIAAWYIAGERAFSLALVGFLMALGPFYMTIVKGQGPMARFILLTYNLSVLYTFSYSQLELKDPENGEHRNVTEIVLHRVISVISGNIWGIIVTRGIWPIRARTKLNETLLSLWHKLVLIWESEPLNTLSNPGAITPVLYMSSRDKAEIERLLSQLEPIQVSARSEIELKAPFPDAAYCNVIRRTKDIVDHFHSMDLILSAIPTPFEGQISLLRYTATTRQQLSGCIRNLLAAIASSMELEHTSDLPTGVNDSRYQLLSQISLYRQDKKASHATNDEDYILLYSYALVTRQLSNEIVQIMGELDHILPSSVNHLVGDVRV
ncbi:hypothetical protein N7478_003644 [Penicillium angulare]|uniref:uncharacterized protein n=1 Tax=Penicillium angulare TaxID=116970 RepID=UPI002540B1A8|nr:uncharacterized protein N7478_003644 [Penicillium angulare]KAJ5287958.1 hypothetical protein N7478_003644 [Penicillium angulare]